MKRLTLSILAVLLASGTASAGYLVGSSGIIQRDNCGLMHAAGYAEYHDDNGNINFNVVVSGHHMIYDDQTGEQIANSPYAQYGTYSSYVEGYPTAGECYRGNVDASASPYGNFGTTYTQSWGSTLVCACTNGGGGGGGDPEDDPSLGGDGGGDCQWEGDCQDIQQTGPTRLRGHAIRTPVGPSAPATITPKRRNRSLEPPPGSPSASGVMSLQR
jgi:hypothetical protein